MVSHSWDTIFFIQKIFKNLLNLRIEKKYYFSIIIICKGGEIMTGYVCEPMQKKSKNGNEYFCLEITFPSGYKKIVFLDNAESFLVMSDIVNGTY